MTDLQWSQAAVAAMLVRCRQMAAAEWQRLADEVAPQKSTP